MSQQPIAGSGEAPETNARVRDLTQYSDEYRFSSRPRAIRALAGSRTLGLDLHSNHSFRLCLSPQGGVPSPLPGAIIPDTGDATCRLA